MGFRGSQGRSVSGTTLSSSLLAQEEKQSGGMLHFSIGQLASLNPMVQRVAGYGPALSRHLAAFSVER